MFSLRLVQQSKVKTIKLSENIEKNLENRGKIFHPRVFLPSKKKIENVCQKWLKCIDYWITADPIKIFQTMR